MEPCDFEALGYLPEESGSLARVVRLVRPRRPAASAVRPWLFRVRAGFVQLAPDDRGAARRGTPDAGTPAQKTEAVSRFQNRATMSAKPRSWSLSTSLPHKHFDLEIGVLVLEGRELLGKLSGLRRGGGDHDEGTRVKGAWPLGERATHRHAHIGRGQRPVLLALHDDVRAVGITADQVDPVLGLALCSVPSELDVACAQDSLE